MKRIIILVLLMVSIQCAFATVYYVSTSGNDAGNGSSGSPWRTLRHAVTKVPASQGHIIKLSAGTFVESGPFNVPPGVSIEGSGIDQTIIKAASSFYFNPSDPGFALDKFLMNLKSDSRTNGSQSLKYFTLDGDGKKLHGGIYIKNRDNITVDNIKVQYTNFCGLWLWDSKNSLIKELKLLNCSWGNAGWASGALQLANLEGMTIDRLNVDENVGYGIKALGSGGNRITNMKVFDSRISVTPNGKWANGAAPNIAFELWEVYLVGCEIYNNYLDNHLSIVNVQTPPTGIQSVRVHHNTFDMLSRAGGNGYAIELTVNDAEIDHNWINGGRYGIANWSPAYTSNWLIHHNTFNNLASYYPGEVVRSEKTGINNVKIYNNSVEFSGTNTMDFLGLHAGQSTNVDIKNNLIINSNTSYSWWPNVVVYTENGATISGLNVSNNFLNNIGVGTTSGTIANNLTGDPKVAKSGTKPNPYFVPQTGSPLIDKGINLGLAFAGTAPEIGAHELGSGTVTTVAVTGVSVSPTTLTLSSGATSQLAKTISPSNATNQSVTWTSSNTDVATVNANGLVTAGTTAGSAVITVRTADGGKTATSTVSVNVPVVSVSSVSIAPSTIILPLSGTSQLVKTLTPANATNQNVTWSSNSDGVATVSATGVVTAKAYGTAVVSCTTADGNKVATASVTVSADIAAIDLDNATLGTGMNQFNYSGTGWAHGVSSSDPYFNKTLSFSNAANNYATVTFTGTKVEMYTAKASHHGIVAVSVDNGPETNVDLYSATRQNFVLVYGSAVLPQGTHTIKMRVTGNKNAAANGAYTILDYIKVYSGSTTTPVSGVSVSPASVTISVNATSQLTKSIAPAGASNQNVTWSSSNTNVATVNANGLVTGVGAGTATITVKTVDGDKTGTAAITVNAPSNAIDFDNGNRGTAMNQFNFSGSGWGHGVSSSDPYLNQTVSFSNATNDFVTVTFIGNKVEFYTAKAAHHGIVGVSIDNGAETNVDLYSAARQNFVMVHSSGVLTQGTHTIKMRVTGLKNAAATGAYAIIDYIKVYSTATGTGGGSNAPEIAAMEVEEEIAQPMQYYPNPLRSGDVLNVSLPEASGEVTLLDIGGVPQRTMSVTDTELQIQTAGLLKGIYLLQYRTAKGREVVKIMVQ
ncbi:Ig-like domain-containing protein [Chryseolinea sp. H1M3-3]|uniref:Ig-like domain-containing protein n=1 Tax=Chryseolinea sp. H1M3-3 TaxID=3034144 RepID=UPI0023EC152B|nr:Ig-like domain-containing protein [Chryseolinea sp. H1M3-3]